ncbi:hypothetical protein CIHG_01180 [Coccidioides immitis H538.4]|nr:hypothetical protein CIHG_01180 [Coccidioides immitis H538.4]
MSLPMLSPFQITGPTVEPYPGTFCMPQVPLPPNITVNVGDNATIQVVEIAKHGAALYNCVDITFAEPEDVEQVTRRNCFNSSHLTAQYIYTVDVDKSAAAHPQMISAGLFLIPLLLVGYFGNLF